MKRLFQEIAITVGQADHYFITIDDTAQFDVVAKGLPASREQRVVKLLLILMRQKRPQMMVKK